MSDVDRALQFLAAVGIFGVELFCPDLALESKVWEGGSVLELSLATFLKSTAMRMSHIENRTLPNAGCIHSFGASNNANNGVYR